MWPVTTMSFDNNMKIVMVKVLDYDLHASKAAEVSRRKFGENSSSFKDILTGGKIIVVDFMAAVVSA